MGVDEKAGSSVDESTGLDGSDRSLDEFDRTDEVSALSFADAERILGEVVRKDDLDEQPTKKMGALSDKEAELLVAASAKRRSVRVFKHPSRPPPRLDLPLATAQYQAIDYSSVTAAPTPQSARRPIAAVALIFAFALGAVVAWAKHTPSVTTTRLTPRESAPEPSASPPTVMSAMTPPTIESPAGTEPADVVPEPDENESDQTGAERAEALLEAAASLRGNELRATLEEAAQADASNPHAASALAEFYMEDDPHEALEWALQASQLRRRRASYRDLVADAHERIGNLNDAARARAAAVALRESD